ncbi:MAG: ATP-binding protein [Alphaproteobacteria bacterium]|nr:ATP-binding protein [Alphaproteobacteria bacterium]
MKHHTLTRSLFLRIAPTILITICIIGVLAFKGATRQIHHVYDAQLISSANLIWLVVEDEMSVEREPFRRIRKIDLTVSNQKALNEVAAIYASSRMFRVWRGNRLAMISDKAPIVGIPQQASGLSYVKDDNGERWRVYSLEIPQTNITVEAGEKISLRAALVKNILLTLAAPLALLVPLVGALIWVGIGSGLGTVRALIAQIRSRSPDDLSPLSLAHVPRDLSPLGNSINQLLQKLEHSFNAEKRFAEHAAHHLRTPLATIKLQLQMMEQARNTQERASSLADLRASIERASRLVGQLLTSTRISHQPVVRQPLNVKQHVIAILTELAAIAAQKQIALSLHGADNLWVMADETLLRLLIGNIIENAVKYTPENGAVDVVLSEDGSTICCAVTDSGPGIPEAERAHVFQRFYRVGTPKAQGTGLGLAIVAEIAARLSGSILLKTPENGVGLRVEIRLPRATVLSAE